MSLRSGNTVASEVKSEARLLLIENRTQYPALVAQLRAQFFRASTEAKIEWNYHQGCLSYQPK